MSTVTLSRARCGLSTWHHNTIVTIITAMTSWHQYDYHGNHDIMTMMGNSLSLVWRVSFDMWETTAVDMPTIMGFNISCGIMHTGCAPWHQWSAPSGQEILEQTGGRLHAFVSGAGTGGTIAGVSHALKDRDPGVQVYLADPPGSSLYNKVCKLCHPISYNLMHIIFIVCDIFVFQNIWKTNNIIVVYAQLWPS